MKLNLITMPFISIFGLALLSGCNIDNIFNPPEEPGNIITIHKIVKYPMAKKLEKEIKTFSGRTIWINVHSFIHSNSIKKIELVPRSPKKRYFDLKLFLNRRGRLRWMQLSAEFRAEPMAFVINGIFYRSFIPQPMVGEYDNNAGTTYAVIEGPFDKGTAEVLKKWALNNYKYFTDDDNDDELL